MPRYIVNTAQFQPFEGLQEALNTYKVAFDKYDNLYNTLDLNASPVGTQIQNDPEALAIYNQWQSDLQAGTDALAKGLSLDDYALAKQVQRSYNDNVLRLNAAVSAKAADVERYNKLNAQAVANGDKLIGTDPTNNKVSAYLDGNKPTSHLVSANGIYKVAKDQAIAAAARYVTTSTGKMFNNEYYKLTKERGIPGGVAIDMLLKSDKYPELNKAFTDTYNQFAIGNLDTDDQKANAISALYAGLAAGLSYDKDVKPYVDHAAVARASGSGNGNDGGMQSPWRPYPQQIKVNGKVYSGTEVEEFLKMLNDPKIKEKLHSAISTSFKENKNITGLSLRDDYVRDPNNLFNKFYDYVNKFGLEEYLHNGMTASRNNSTFDDSKVDLNGMKQALLKTRVANTIYKYDLDVTDNNRLLNALDHHLASNPELVRRNNDIISRNTYSADFDGKERQGTIQFNEAGHLVFRETLHGKDVKKKDRDNYVDVELEIFDLMPQYSRLGGPGLTTLVQYADQAYKTENYELLNDIIPNILDHVAASGLVQAQVIGNTNKDADYSEMPVGVEGSIYYNKNE